jgi:predicted transcriptional regulator
MTTTYSRRSHDSVSPESIRVADAMHRGVVSCSPDARLATVARMMAAHRIHAVVVGLGEDATEWSLVSDLDLAAAICDGALEHATAGKLASPPNLRVQTDETLARAAQLMREYDTHHLIVVGGDSDRPVGILSTLDIADVVAELPQPQMPGAKGQ